MQSFSSVIYNEPVPTGVNSADIQRGVATYPPHIIPVFILSCWLFDTISGYDVRIGPSISPDFSGVRLTGINFTIGCLPTISNSGGCVRTERKLTKNPNNRWKWTRVRERTSAKGDYDASWGRSPFLDYYPSCTTDKLPY
ncbi:hypothetical protein Zmor_018102 [Zophobas morio]|uniref:Uncharacterized protein n=1 Tax=Zophobas morio TaxID=2755281 RepID=A0AA38IDQ5_9CUCU|nr:hypothetical protein Zmor_018102 [Zophobas morio]